jgi:hypothetical protein
LIEEAQTVRASLKYLDDEHGPMFMIGNNPLPHIDEESIPCAFLI